VQSHLTSRNILVLLLLLSATVATFVPYASARLNTGDEWRGVTPELSYDALYLFSRANDVTRGNLFVGNPYFFEHRNDPALISSFNDVVVALPQLLGFSFNVGYYVNIFLWGLLLLCVLYVLFCTHSVSPPLSFLGALWCYLGVYGDMLRPGIMQIIYPLFVLFLLLFWRYIDQKNGSVLPLAITVGITGYFYIHLFMLVVAILAVYVAAILLLRNWVELRRVLWMGVVAVGVIMPHIVHSLFLASQPFYLDTLVRISMSFSHWPQIEVYYYGRWIVLVLLIVSLLRRYYPDSISRATNFFVLITGFGILLAMGSNIFTGRDFVIAEHIARFGIIWYLAVGIILISPISDFVFYQHGPLWRRMQIGLLFGLLIFQMFMNLNRSIPHFGVLREQFTEVQTYAGVLSWLKEQPEGVVVAPPDLNSYISPLTKQYVLYNMYGAQFGVGNDEIRERYLLYHALDHLSENEFLEKSNEFYGPAPSYLAKTSALRFRICRLLPSEKNCSAPKPEQSFVDIVALRKKFEAYYLDLPAQIAQEYAKYHVRYVISKTGDTKMSSKLPSCVPVYHDQWFGVCKIVY
jgi:hypothetical protein